MNEVETYLRQSGNWGIAIDTDWRGRAKPGKWWQRYYSQWLDAHDAFRKDRDIDPGGWARGDDGNEWWLTDTPDWDREWFNGQGVQPPPRFGEKANTYWKDYGGGLSGRAYRPDISVTLGDGGWSAKDWVQVLAAAAACVAIITLLALLIFAR